MEKRKLKHLLSIYCAEKHPNFKVHTLMNGDIAAIDPNTHQWLVQIHLFNGNTVDFSSVHYGFDEDNFLNFVDSMCD